MIPLTKDQKERLMKKLNEIYGESPEYDLLDPKNGKMLFRKFWSSRVGALAADMRKIDQATTASWAAAFTKYVV